MTGIMLQQVWNDPMQAWTLEWLPCRSLEQLKRLTTVTNWILLPVVCAKAMYVIAGSEHKSS